MPTLYKALIAPIALCVCAMSVCADSAFCAAETRMMHGSWMIALEDTQKEDLQVFFGANDEQDILAKASSTIFTFDLQKMLFRRNVRGEETVLRIREITRDRDLSPDTFILWLERVKFPDYIVELPDGRLRYGSTWARPWELILQRK